MTQYVQVMLNLCLTVVCLDNTSLCIDYPVESCKITVFLLGSVLPNTRMTSLTL